MRSAVFLVLLLLVCSWHLDHGANDNTMSRAAAVASLVDRGTLEITPIHEATKDKAVVDGRYYSDKAPLPVLLVWPFHALMVRLGLVEHSAMGSLVPGLLRLGGFLCGSVALVLIIALVYRDIRTHGASLPLPAAWLATLPFLGSFLFVYSGSFFAHLLGALFILLAWTAFERGRWWWCGLWGGAAVLCEFPLAVFPVWWALEVAFRAWRERQGPRALYMLVLGGLPALVVLVVVNLAITGEPFTLAYAHEAHYTFMDKGYGTGMPSWEAITGLTVSSYRGLFVFMPAAAIALVAIATAHLLGVPLVPRAAAVPMLLCTLVIAGYGMWWGGWAYGPRHLAAVATLLMLFGTRALAGMRRSRWPLLIAGAIGMVMAFGAKSTVWYSFPTEVRSPMRVEVWPRIASLDLTSMQWPVLLGLSPAASTVLFLLLVAGMFLFTARTNTR
jgi:hypothetical protein